MESNEQLIFEMVRWFDKYVKDAPPRSPKGPAKVNAMTGAAPKTPPKVNGSKK